MNLYDIDKLERAIKICTPIFTHLFKSPLPEMIDATGQEFTVFSFVSGAIRCIDSGELRFLTQNPNQDNVWGKKAKAGQEIGWVIEQKNNNPLLRWESGTVIILQEPV